LSSAAEELGRLDFEGGRGERGVGAGGSNEGGSNEVRVGVSSGLSAVAASEARGGLDRAVGASDADVGTLPLANVAPQEEQKRAGGGT